MAGLEQPVADRLRRTPARRRARRSGRRRARPPSAHPRPVPRAALLLARARDATALLGPGRRRVGVGRGRRGRRNGGRRRGWHGHAARRGLVLVDGMFVDPDVDRHGGAALDLRPGVGSLGDDLAVQSPFADRLGTGDGRSGRLRRAWRGRSLALSDDVGHRHFAWLASPRSDRRTAGQQLPPVGDCEDRVVAGSRAWRVDHAHLQARRPASVARALQRGCPTTVGTTTGAGPLETSTITTAAVTQFRARRRHGRRSPDATATVVLARVCTVRGLKPPSCATGSPRRGSGRRRPAAGALPGPAREQRRRRSTTWAGACRLAGEVSTHVGRPAR